MIRPKFFVTHWLTVSELAKELNVSKWTLARWRKAGNGPPWFRFGGRIQYRTEAVQRWLDSLGSSK